MNNGCICCTVRGDLVRILGRLMKRKDKLDGVIIVRTAASYRCLAPVQWQRLSLAHLARRCVHVRRKPRAWPTQPLWRKPSSWIQVSQAATRYPKLFLLRFVEQSLPFRRSGNARF
jgi:hypothetical protein